MDRYGSEPRKGADILVQALEREGVGRVFAYPGGASMEIHQALTRSPIRNILCRHEQVRPMFRLLPLPHSHACLEGVCGIAVGTTGGINVSALHGMQPFRPARRLVLQVACHAILRSARSWRLQL